MTNQPSKKEIAEMRAKVREISLKNLKAKPLVNLATSYFAQANNAYGESGNSDVEKHLYWPAMEGNETKAYDFETGKEYELKRKSILDSRQEGRRYSGQISEQEIIHEAAQIIQASLQGVKVIDVYDLLGSSDEVKKEIDRNAEHKEKYLSELLEGNDAQKAFAETVIGMYMSYITKEAVEKAVGESKKELKSGLEKIATDKDIYKNVVDAKERFASNGKRNLEKKVA
jgi:hypothetical protein